jgi:hypothetical protein
MLGLIEPSAIEVRLTLTISSNPDVNLKLGKKQIF